MVYLLSILVLVAVATCGAEKPILVLAPELATFLTQKAKLCQSETGVDPSVLKKILPWKLEESEINGKLMHCLIREVNFLGSNDRIDLDKFIDIFGKSLKSEETDEVKNIMAECNKETGDNRYITIFRIANCFHTNTPFSMSLH